MERKETISSAEFYSKFKHTGEGRHAIFGERKALMEELYATGIPIYCDQSYYIHEQKLDLVKKVSNHFECEAYKNFEDWRDCHYYGLYADADGNKIWKMTGGRYD